MPVPLLLESATGPSASGRLSGVSSLLCTRIRPLGALKLVDRGHQRRGAWSVPIGLTRPTFSPEKHADTRLEIDQNIPTERAGGGGAFQRRMEAGETLEGQTEAGLRGNHGCWRELDKTMPRRSSREPIRTPSLSAGAAPPYHYLMPVQCFSPRNPPSR